MLQLRIKAPFAAFRPFVTGSYRPTAPFLTPSAAYGLLLNIAVLDMRYDDGESPMTVIRSDLPRAEVALGAISLPERQTLFQQLHNYPVGSTGKERLPESRGNKYNIQPARRELLIDLDAYICLRANDELEERVRTGLRLGGRLASPEGRPRYGLPFLGDNSFLLSVLREEEVITPAHWLVPAEGDSTDSSSTLSRLTVWIDRRHSSNTISRLYRLTAEPSSQIPTVAWTTMPPSEARV